MRFELHHVLMTALLLLIADTSLAHHSGNYIQPDVNGCLNFRRSVNGRRIRCLSNSAKLKKIRTRGNWIQVEHNGTRGWVYSPRGRNTKSFRSASSSSSSSSSSTSQKISTPSSQTVSSSSSKSFVTPDTSSCLNFRRSPNGRRISCLNNKQKLEVLGKSGNWLKVKRNNQVGYIWSPQGRNTKTYTPPASTPVVQTPTLPSKKPTTSSGDSFINKIGNGISSVGSTITNTIGNAVSSVIPKKQPEYVRPYVDEDSCLNLRKKIGGGKIACIPGGSRMKVIERGKDFTKVKYGDKTGYVSSRYVRDAKDSGIDPNNVASFDSDGSGKYKARWKRKHYTEIVSQALDRHGRDLLTRTPRDINRWCPNYRNLNQHDKKQFWIYMISSLSVFESNHNTATQFREPASLRGGCLKGGRVMSRGILQLSAKSAGQNAYYQAGCRTRQGRRLTCSTANQLHDPRVNLTCGVAIMNTWVRRDGAIKGPGNRGGARYWSPFRSSKKRGKMMAWTKRIKVCQRGYRSKGTGFRLSLAGNTGEAGSQ